MPSSEKCFNLRLLKVSFYCCIILVLTYFGLQKVQAQVTLGASPYTQNFNSIGGGLPTGWGVYTGANAASPGASAAFSTAATAWANTTGAFNNRASANAPATSADASGTQSANPDRALAVRQSGSFGDPGASFALQIANTTGLTNFSLSFKLMQLDPGSPARTTTWNVDYGFGATPGAFTNVTTAPVTLTTTVGTWGTTNVTVSFGSLLDNNSGPVWIRICAKTSSTGSGSRPVTAIDDYNLSWIACALPSITSQPANSSICAAGSTSFSVAASGFTGFQWEVSTNGGGSWSALSNGGVYSNVTTNTLNITGATVPMNNYQYRCIVYNGPCSVTSNAVVLNVGGAFSIVVQPADYIACVGNSAIFNITTTPGVISFQWQLSTDGGLSFSNLANGAPYSGVTTSSLNISSTGIGMNGYIYQCILSNGGCTASATSNPAMLTVGGPAFVVNPGYQSTCVNGSVTFNVVTTGVAPTYIWEMSTNGGASWGIIPLGPPYSGNASASLNINPAVLSMNNYQFRCVATDGGCPSTSSAATLTVSNGPAILTQPSNVTTPAGTNATFTVNAVNTTSYQWEESVNGGATWTPLTNTPPYSGVSTAVLTVSGVTIAMNGYMYRCVLTGCVPPVNVTTNNATLVIGVAGGTVLLPGDLVFVGYDSRNGTGAGCSTNTNTDKYYIANLVDLAPGTKFKIVNSRFEAGAAANVRTNYWRGSGDAPFEDPAYIELTWNAITNLPKGSITTVTTIGTTPNATVSNISVNGVTTASYAYTVSGTANISSSDPDQIYLIQGTFIPLGTINVDRYNLMTGKVLFGMTNKAAWVPLSSSCSAGVGGANRVSRLPDDIECFNLESTLMREVYYYLNSALHNGSQRQLLGAIMTAANWSQPSSTNCLDIPEDWTGATGTSAGKQFTFLAGNPPGYWVGDFNIDWFNCRNWESFTVPDPTVDVIVPAAAINDCYVDISAFPVTAAKYGNVAQCKNISITGRKLVLENDINDRLTSYGNLLISGTGTVDMNDGNNVTADGQIYLIGNWTNQILQTNFDEGNSTVRFLGAGTQLITTSPVDRNEAFYNVILDNNTSFTIDGDVTVSGNMNMINGVVNPIAMATDEVIFTDNATVTNLTANSYVAGKVRKIGNDAFVFPTGKNLKWARIAMSAPVTTAAEFQAEYFKAGYGIYLVNSPLDHVSTMEYWNLNTLAAVSPVSVTLYWEDGAWSGITGPLSPDLRVAHFNGTAWDDNGNTNVTGTVPIGTVRSTVPVTDFGSFTFGSITPDNPLPVQLSDFTAKTVNNERVKLNWITQSELNNDYFDVMRSQDGNHFETIGQVTGLGTTTSVTKYVFEDAAPFHGISYYRLRQVDYNGQYELSVTRQVNINKGKSAITAWIENNTIHALIDTDMGGNAVTEITDASGRIISRKIFYFGAGQTTFHIQKPDAPGIYFLRIITAEGSFVLKFAK